MNKGIWIVLILLMSAYVLYEHSISDCAISPWEQLARHQRMLDGNSEYFNPWQYRVLSMFILEGAIRLFKILLPTQHVLIPYFLLHYLQIALLLYLCLIYFQKLEIKNPFLALCGLMILTFCFANSSYKSDFSYNTYFDITFYVAAALMILAGHSIWIIPLTVVAALNRETSGFIPLMLIMPFPLTTWRMTLTSERLSISALSLALFAFIFFLVRWYYGYRSYEGVNQMTTPMDFFFFNATFFRTYPLLLGTLGVIPLIVILNLKLLPPLLQGWFWLIVPFWFVLHFFQSNAMETRLFLVPQTLLFVPSFLIITEQWYSGVYNSSIKNV